MADDRDLQKRVQTVGSLVHDLETIADPVSRAAVKELVQLLIDLQGAGFERVLEIIYKSNGTGAQLIDELGEDSLIGSLLVLHGIHPDDVQTRVEKKLKQIDSRLHKMGAQATLVSSVEGMIRIRVSLQGHVCGSTSKNVRSTVEEAIYEAAPDLSSLVLEGLEEPGASGFVGIEQLTTPVAPVDSPRVHAAVLNDGMD